MKERGEVLQRDREKMEGEFYVKEVRENLKNCNSFGQGLHKNRDKFRRN